MFSLLTTSWSSCINPFPRREREQSPWTERIMSGLEVPEIGSTPCWTGEREQLPTAAFWGMIRI
jgi:hypothetical protein